MPHHDSYVRAFITQKDGTFLYGLDICEEAIDPRTDYQTHSHGIRVVVDHYSAVFLVGAEIDYAARGQEQGFIFNNPIAMPR